MQCLVERDPLLAVVQAAVKMKTPEYHSGTVIGRVVLQHQDGLLRISATNTITHMDCYLPARFANTTGAIATKAKEWAYLLKNIHIPLVELIDCHLSGVEDENHHLMGAVVADGTAHPFPDEQSVDWEDHQTEPAEVMATIRIDALARALELVNDFQSHKSEGRCYGALIEPGQAGLRFVATNLHCLAMMDAQVGLYSMPGKQMVYVEEPAIQLLRACVKLWDEVDPTEMDCEIRVVQRSVTSTVDGEVRELDPIVIFDLSGCGYRVLVTTIAQGEFPSYRLILKDAEKPGVCVTAERRDLLELCKLANQQDDKRSGKVVFKFQQANSSVDCPVDVRAGYILKNKDLPTNRTYTNRDIVPYQLAATAMQVQGGMLDVSAEDLLDGMTNRIVTLDAKYLGSMLPHFDDDQVVLRFHGVVDSIEVVSQIQNIDPRYFIFMPVYQTVQEDAL